MESDGPHVDRSSLGLLGSTPSTVELEPEQDSYTHNILIEEVPGENRLPYESPIDSQPTRRNGPTKSCSSFASKTSGHERKEDA